MIKYPKSINDSIVGNIKYRNNVVTGTVAADNGNYTYDVYIAGEDTAYPNIHTTQKYPEFSTGDSVELLMEYGSKEMPIIIGYAKKIVQEIAEVDMNVLVTTLDAYGTTETSTYLEGRIEDIEGYENCLLRGFHYGLTTAYGSDTYTTGSFAAGSYAIQTTGLTANSDYHFCAYVYDADGDEQTGENKSFTTTVITKYLISCSDTDSTIYVHSGISSGISSSFPAPSSHPRGLAYDGTNLISCDYGNATIYVHLGISSGTTSSFPAFHDYPTGLAFDGTNLISCFPTGAYDRIYIHSGISTGILDSYSASKTNTQGLAFDGTNLIELAPDYIYVHSGVSSGISSSFHAPTLTAKGLAFDGTNLISCDRTTIYVHSGISSGISSSFPASSTDTQGLTIHS